MTRRGLALVAVIAACCTAVPVTAQDDVGEEEPELVAELIHSDLPLYSFEWEDFWPRNFYDEDSFGCTSRVRFGDWEFKPDVANAYGDTLWYRFQNYGVFHCAANLRTAYEREELQEGEFSRGFFVRMGEQTLGGERWELWAFQQGMVPGSDYLLLARQPDEDGIIQRFRVLQRHCPEGRMRELDGLDVWSTDYCAINSRAELLELAENMLQLPPLGVLERAGDPPDEEGVTEEATDRESDASTE